MIKLNNVSKSFDGKKMAVDHLNLTFEDGEIIGFIGPNGAGKTTTLKMITGILKPTTGNITINGFDVQLEPLKAKASFGFVADNPDIFLRLKGIEYLNFIADVYGVSVQQRQIKIRTLAEEFELFDALNNVIASYSHGMRQKLIIIGALLHDPKTWLLDEPLTGLDPQSSYLLKQKMREHAKLNNTVLFSTHVLEVAEKLCDKIAIINHGKIVYYGTMDELIVQNPNQSLEEIFLKVTNHD
jgi:ABC-2 type transport system ATP-binding protein